MLVVSAPPPPTRLQTPAMRQKESLTGTVVKADTEDTTAARDNKLNFMVSINSIGGWMMIVRTATSNKVQQWMAVGSQTNSIVGVVVSQREHVRTYFGKKEAMRVKVIFIPCVLQHGRPTEIHPQKKTLYVRSQK